MSRRGRGKEEETHDTTLLSRTRRRKAREEQEGELSNFLYLFRIFPHSAKEEKVWVSSLFPLFLQLPAMIASRNRHSLSSPLFSSRLGLDKAAALLFFFLSFSLFSLPPPRTTKRASFSSQKTNPIQERRVAPEKRKSTVVLLLLLLFSPLAEADRTCQVPTWEKERVARRKKKERPCTEKISPSPEP